MPSENLVVSVAVASRDANAAMFGVKTEAENLGGCKSVLEVAGKHVTVNCHVSDG